MKLEELNLSERTSNTARRLGIDRVDQLAAYTEAELLALPMFGPTALREVQKALASEGLNLRTQHPGHQHSWVLLTANVVPRRNDKMQISVQRVWCPECDEIKDTPKDRP